MWHEANPDATISAANWLSVAEKATVATLAQLTLQNAALEAAGGSRRGTEWNRVLQLGAGLDQLGPKLCWLCLCLHFFVVSFCAAAALPRHDCPRDSWLWFRLLHEAGSEGGAGCRVQSWGHHMPHAVHNRQTGCLLCCRWSWSWSWSRRWSWEWGSCLFPRVKRRFSSFLCNLLCVCVYVCVVYFVCICVSASVSVSVSVSGSERGCMHRFLCGPHDLVWCEKLSKCFSYCFYNFVICDARGRLLLFFLRPLLLLLLLPKKDNTRFWCNANPLFAYGRYRKIHLHRCTI